MEKHNRRRFIRNGIVGLSGAAIAPLSLKNHSTGLQTVGERKMIYRTLGKTGIKLPVVSMGAAHTTNPNLIRAAMDEGVVLFATSEYYGNNEEIIGKIVKERERDSVMVMTTARPAGIDHEAGLFTDEETPEKYMKQVEACMKRLDMDPIDIFVLPFAARRESVFFEPLLSVMEKIKKQGKARYIGIATHSWEHESIRAAVDVGIYDVVMTQYNCRHKNIDEIDRALDYATANGMGIIAMKTMAGGYWDDDRKLAINKKASLKWILKNENIHTTVPGFSTFDQMQEDLSVMEDLQMTEQEKADLKLADAYMPSGLFCQQCGVCRPQCRKGHDIPTAMRSYMYVYGYKNLRYAQQTLKDTNLTEDPCSGCISCSVKCKMGFDVRRKLEDIARLKKVPEDFLGT